MGHNRRLYCYGNWYDRGETQHTNLQEHTPEARAHHANSTAKKMQVEGAAPEPVSEAGEPIFVPFLWAYSLTLRRLPKQLLKARNRFLPVAREPSSLTLETAQRAVFGSLEPIVEPLPTTI